MSKTYKDAINWWSKQSY